MILRSTKAHAGSSCSDYSECRNCCHFFPTPGLINYSKNVCVAHYPNYFFFISVCASDPEESGVSVEVEDGHPPDACKQLRPELEESGADQLGGLPQVPVMSGQHVEHLPLASLDASRVQVADLQVCEELLGWRAIIRVWPCKHDWNSEGSHRLQRVGSDVVAGTVEQNDRVFPPVRILCIEDECEPEHECTEDSLVSRRLAYGEVGEPVSVDSRQQRQPLAEWLDALPSALVCIAPSVPDEQALTDGGLVDVDDALPFHHLAEQ